MNRSISTSDRRMIEECLLAAARRGFGHAEAAKAGNIHRSTLHRWLVSDANFAARYARARERGKDRRDYQRWKHHPFRGFRPPTGKRTRRFPRYGI